MTYTVMEPYKGELICKILVYQLEHVSQNGKLGVNKISFSQQGFFDQMCCETSRFMTTWWDILSPHYAEG